MAKKKEHEEPEGEGNSERWLLTYADMITLLLALFIILYSMSTIDAKKMAQVAQEFGVAMGTSKTGAGSGTGTGTGNGTGTEDGGGLGEGMQKDALDEIYSVLKDYIKDNGLQGVVSLDNTETYVKIQLKDVLMFVPDSSMMLDSSEPVVRQISSAITKVVGRIDHVTISGHTADTGDRSASSDQASWRLSTERAVTVLNQMVTYGLPQDKISIEGYAYFSPVANNNTEEGRSKNRRVEITITKIQQDKIEAPAVTQSPNAAPHE